MSINPKNLEEVDLKIARLSSVSAPDFSTTDNIWTSTSTITPMMVPDTAQAFAMTARTGHYYQVKFGHDNHDFKSFTMRLTPNWPSNEPGIVIRFKTIKKR